MTLSAQLEDERGPLLLAVARAALLKSVGRPGGRPAERPDWLMEPGACFVTLQRSGELRGCIGTLQPYRPLEEDVIGNTRAAALSDPRFPAMTAAEVEDVAVEVSVLSELEPLEFLSETELRIQLRPHIDGVCLAYQGRRGTFLPQVWETLPDPARFVAGLKRKAGLPPDFWSPEIEGWRFTVEKYSEVVVA